MRRTQASCDFLGTNVGLCAFTSVEFSHFALSSVELEPFGVTTDERVQLDLCPHPCLARLMPMMVAVHVLDDRLGICPH